MTVRATIQYLVLRRGSEGRWIYLIWLLGYGAVALTAVTYAAVLGQEYLPAFVVFLVPALIAYVQFRYPTVLGWAALAVPTAMWAAIGIVLFLGSVLVGDFRLEAALMALWLGTVSWGFVHYRPFGRGRARA